MSHTGDKRRRVMAALRGDVVDPIPCGFWAHNYAKENSAHELAEETLRVAHELDWDFLKVQSRFTCFAEPWGAAWQATGQPHALPRLVRPAVDDAHDLKRLPSRTVDVRPLTEQVEALAIVRKHLGDDRPILMTVFSPLMTLNFCFRDAPGRSPALRNALRTDPETVERALDAVTDVLATFARECVAAGADGIFFATNVAVADYLTVEEVRRFQRPYDLRVLEAVASAPFNLLHLCGDRVHFDEFVDYPVQAFNWALGPHNPTLIDGARRTGRAVVGGVSAKPMLRGMSVEQVVDEVRNAVAEMGGRRLLVGPGCSVDPDTPTRNVVAARDAVRGTRSETAGLSPTYAV